MAVVRDFKIRAKLNVQIFEQTDRGSEKPGKDARGASILNASMPEIVVDEAEWNRRLADATLVLHEGWELDNDGPPKAVTEGVTLLTATTVTLHGRVSTNGATSCGFVWSTTKEVNTHTQDAAESPIGVNLDDQPVTAAIIGLTASTKYYYRAWANTAGLNTRYGNVRSFTTPAV